MADAGLVLGIVPNADVDTVLVDDRSGNEVVARTLAAELVLGILRVAVKLPEQLAGVRVEGPNPAVATREDDLLLAGDDGVGGVGPLAVLQQLGPVDEVLEEVALLA